MQADLDEALPASRESAVQALNTINDKDIDAVRKLSKPPATVKLVAEGRLCHARREAREDPRPRR